jgi:hypothetical protein
MSKGKTIFQVGEKAAITDLLDIPGPASPRSLPPSSNSFIFFIFVARWVVPLFVHFLAQITPGLFIVSQPAR